MKKSDTSAIYSIAGILPVPGLKHPRLRRLRTIWTVGSILISSAVYAEGTPPDTKTPAVQIEASIAPKSPTVVSTFLSTPE